jgi:hypothetical protein
MFFLYTILIYNHLYLQFSARVAFSLMQSLHACIFFYIFIFFSIRITQNRRMYVLSIYPGPHKRHTYKMLLTIVSDVCKACLQLLPSARFPHDDFIYLPTFALFLLN